MDQRVPTVQTTPTMLDFARALIRAWRAVVGTVPTKTQAAVLWAHFAGETGDGRYCYCWNLGNYKHTPGSGGAYCYLRGVWEGVSPARAEQLIATGRWAADPSKDHAIAVGPGKVSVVATEDNPASWFRAFASLEDGMVSFIDAKRSPASRYASAWRYVEAGDPDGYARELGRRGYYTASPDAYARAMRGKWHAWMAADAFERALDELIAASNAETLPTLPDLGPESDEEPEPSRIHRAEDLGLFERVHPKVPLGRPALDDLDDPSEEPKA